jgi:hypothetical protein
MVFTFHPEFDENGERRLGSFMGSAWCQIHARHIGSNQVLLAFAIFIDKSYTRVNVPVKPAFGECCSCAARRRGPFVETVQLKLVFCSDFAECSRVNAVQGGRSTVFGLLSSLQLRRSHRLQRCEERKGAAASSRLLPGVV